MTAAAPIRVLVVDDSAVIRKIVTSVLSADPGITVVGTAANGAIGVEQVAALDPDLVTLDVEMPVMDGLAALRAIRRLKPRLPVIMFSTLTERGASATLDALAAGASDYVTKPSNVDSFPQAMAAVREELIPKARALTARRRLVPPTPTVGPVRPLGGSVGRPSTPQPPAATRSHRPRARPEVLAIGCSTGGPDALAKVVTHLTASTPVPVVIVQHMPPLFTTLFAQRLDKASGLEVHEAVDGEPLRPGVALVAPGDFHLTVRRDGGIVKASLSQGPAENFCRPAVDTLFRSVASVYGGSTLAVILTGMGHDGRDGCKALAGVGAGVLVQDEATSVVWGMPGAVAQAGLADEILPIEAIGPAIVARFSTGAAASASPRPTREVVA